MSTSISIKDNEVMLLFISTLKNRFLQKLKKMNVEAKITLKENEWMKNLFYGDLETKNLSLYGRSYEFEMIICAVPDGTVVMELLFEKNFEQEMKAKGMNYNLLKRIGSSNCTEEIYCGATQSFYLEDLVIVNNDRNEKIKQMFGKNGELSWELSGLSWELNISGISIPVSSKNTVTSAATSPSQAGGITAAPIISVTNPTPVSVTYSVPPPNLPLLGATATLPTTQPTLVNTTVRAPGRHPPILDAIQQSLQNKTPNLQSVQYLTTANTFSVPPPQIPRMPASSIPRMPASSTPKKHKNRTKKKLLKKILPLPMETTETESNDEETRHHYETLGGESSISEIQGERETTPRPGETSSTVRLDDTEYVPASKVAELVEEAVNKLLVEGIIVRAESSENSEPKKTVVTLDNEPTEVIQDIINLPSIFQNLSAKESEEKENNKSVTEKGENSGPETRSKTKAKGPEEQY